MRRPASISPPHEAGRVSFRDRQTSRPHGAVWLRLAAPASDDQPAALLTVPEACAALRVSKWTLYRLIHSGQLETIKLGSSRRIPIRAITALVERLGGSGGAAL